MRRPTFTSIKSMSHLYPGGEVSSGKSGTCFHPSNIRFITSLQPRKNHPSHQWPPGNTTQLWSHINLMFWKKRVRERLHE
ncbi:hypothetical protein Bca4012_011161 [Brassica carinata]|uniref:Uncharacterized protein n=1 Tax=Brassica carinata TaxID=52824 RepID=A0A8X7V292_BRACI|nr:hypothetical protein Bca52824_036006 [Brassica carinata]